MDDKTIVALYFDRSEDAIAASAQIYGAYCRTIALRILKDASDAEECVSDTWQRAWEAIPPHRPENLATFLGKITRNLALNRLQKSTAAKRAAPITLILDEAAEILPSPEADGDRIADEIHLRDTIEGFLRTLPARERILFVRRYWYFDPIKQIARDLEMSEGTAKVTLMRTRIKLKDHLEKEGIHV